VDRRWPACISIFILSLIFLERKVIFSGLNRNPYISAIAVYSTWQRSKCLFPSYVTDFCLPPSYHQIDAFVPSLNAWDRLVSNCIRISVLKSILRSHCSDLLKCFCEHCPARVIPLRLIIKKKMFRLNSKAKRSISELLPICSII
jgi:hypothetical protein